MNIPADAALAFQREPLAFVRFHWPEMMLYGKQLEILESVRDNVETFCHAGHKLGKDRTAAILALWFFCTRSPARVIVTSSSQKQLKDTLWGEIRALEIEAAKAGRALGIHTQFLECKKPDGKGGFLPLDYIVGIAAGKGESFHGHHLDAATMPRVFVILSEASAIEDVHYQAAQTQAQRILATGNPVADIGFFHQQCTAGDESHPLGKGLLRKVVHIDGEAHNPNVLAGIRWNAEQRGGDPPILVPGILNYEEYLLRLRWPEDQRVTRLHGRFLEGKGDKLFPAALLYAAQNAGTIIAAARAAGLLNKRHGPLCLGVDTARGGDFTVWTILGRFGVVAKIRRQTANTTEIQGQTIRLMRTYSIRPENVYFDSGGGGKEHADALRDKGYQVLDVGFGESANDPKQYKNMRAELYGEARRLMEAGARWERTLRDVPPDKWPDEMECLSFSPTDTLLRQDLFVLPKGTDGEGRLRLPPKDRPLARHGSAEKTIRELLGRSPDDGDSFVLAVYAYRVMRERRRLGIPSRPLVH